MSNHDGQSEFQIEKIDHSDLKSRFQSELYKKNSVHHGREAISPCAVLTAIEMAYFMRSINNVLFHPTAKGLRSRKLRITHAR